MKKIATFLTFIIIATTYLSAQKARFAGQVHDNKNLPLPGANIVIPSLTIGTATDLNGNFLISNLEPGDYTVEIRYIGYQTQTVEVSLKPGITSTANIVLDEGIEIGEVLITQRLQGEQKALNTQKTRMNITNIVASEQIERFPDANIGDALKRLPGINVMYDQGEARFANIRGTQPELNSVTLNGERIPSAEAEKRFVQLDLVPADMIQTIEVNKAVTPDMDADAIGGSINLVTKTAASDRTVSGTLGSGYNFISSKPVLKGNLTYSDRFANDKLGVVIGASYFNNPMESHDIEGEWVYDDESDKDGSAYPEDFQNRQYFVTRDRQSYSLGLDYQPNADHKFYLSGIYNHRNDYENRFRLRYKDIEWDDDAGSYIATIEREIKGGRDDTRDARLEDQRMMNFKGGGEHLFGNLKADWSASFSRASEERPNERYIVMAAEDVQVSLVDQESFFSKPRVVPSPEVSDLNSNYKLDELTNEYQYTEETDKNFSLNFELPLVSGEYANKIKFGARYRGKNKYRDNDFYEYEPVDEDGFLAEALLNKESVSRANFLAGNYLLGSFVSNEYLGALDLGSSQFDEEHVIEELAGNFDAKENVLAAYIMITQNLGPDFTILAGLRIENTILEYSGYRHFIDENDEREEWLEETGVVEDNYINILPAVHLKYEPSDNTNLRLAWTNTIARPNYFDIVPYTEINADDSEIALGNPELLPTTSMNIDLLAEHFFSNIGIISGGMFYKKLDNVISMTIDDDYQYTYGGSTESWKLVQPVNVGNGVLFGFEGAFSRRLDFLPSFLRNLSLYANYTYNSSKLTDIQIEGREDEDLEIPGTPPHILNLSLAYDTKVFDIRVSYSHSSAFRDGEEGGYGEEAFYDRWYDKVNYLDVNANISLTEKLKLYVDVNNILNQPLRYYQGVEDRTMQAEYYGLRVKAGLRFRF